MNKLFQTLAIIVMTFVALPAQAQSRDQAIKDCDQDRDPDRRIAGCTQLIKSGTLSARQQSFAYNSRGNAWRDKDDNERAIPDYDEAIRLNPTYAHPYLGRGNANRELGEFDRAIADYNEAIRLDPRDPYIYHGRANVWVDRGRVRPRHRRLNRGDQPRSEVCGILQRTRHRLEPEGRVRPRAARPRRGDPPRSEGTAVSLQPRRDLAAARRSGAVARRSQPGDPAGAGPRAGPGLSRRHAALHGPVRSCARRLRPGVARPAPVPAGLRRQGADLRADERSRSRPRRVREGDRLDEPAQGRRQPVGARNRAGAARGVRFGRAAAGHPGGAVAGVVGAVDSNAGHRRSGRAVPATVKTGPACRADHRQCRLPERRSAEKSAERRAGDRRVAAPCRLRDRLGGRRRHAREDGRSFACVPRRGGSGRVGGGLLLGSRHGGERDELSHPGRCADCRRSRHPVRGGAARPGDGGGRGRAAS